jgi:uncharacterized protein (TIGR02246 family)
MRQVIVSVCLLVVGTIGLVLAADSPKPANSPSVNGKNPRLVQASAKVEASALKTSPGDAVVKQATDVLLKAYAVGDAKALAGAFTTEGEYVDAKGTVFHGRQAIEDEFVAFFRETPGTTIEIEANSSRPIATGVIAADCTTRFKKTSTSVPILGRCQIVCSRDGENWSIASLREFDGLGGGSSHHTQISQLEWLVGEWIGEGQRSHVHFSCRWDEDGNYLLRDFSVQAAGANPLKGTQRIGYDPISGHLKMWVFDAAGGFSEGYFTRDGDSWVVRTSGVTSDGQLASTTNAYTKIDDHRITSELIDRSVAGHRTAHAEKMTLVRKPPSSTDRSTQGSRSKD